MVGRLETGLWTLSREKKKKGAAAAKAVLSDLWLYYGILWIDLFYKVSRGTTVSCEDVGSEVTFFFLFLLKKPITSFGVRLVPGFVAWY